MNKEIKKIIALSVFGLLTVFIPLANAENEPRNTGELIAQKNVAGYDFRYSLLNLEQRKEVMKGMEGMKMHGMSDSPDVTHHLTVYVNGKGGKPESGKIGFIITHPDGTTFKTLTMGMHGGYGADVMFKKKGGYKIQIKAVIAGKTIHDEILYEVR